MNRLMADLMQRHAPVANPVIGDGLACLYIPKAEQYINAVLLSAQNSFPPGLKYVNYQRCTPEEEYNEVTRPRNNKRVYDLAESSLFAVKYFFTYGPDNTPLEPRYLYLPYVQEAGILQLGGSQYHISPIITDSVISPSFNTVFVRLLRKRLICDRLLHTIMIDGAQETGYVVWSEIHHRTAAMQGVPATTKAKTCLVHYLLGKYGLSEMLRRFANVTTLVVTDQPVDRTRYPETDWVVCASRYPTCGLKPTTFLSTFYEPSPIQVLIPRASWTPAVKALLIGFFYVVDHFPSQMRAGYVDSEMLWKTLLGHIIKSGVYSAQVLHDFIMDHYDSIDEYVDTLVVDQLRELGYPIQEFYELLFLIIDQFDTWLNQFERSSTSQYKKTLEILYNTLYDITSAIFRTVFQLKKASKKKQLQARDITQVMDKYLKTGEIFRLNQGNIAVSSVSYSGDNRYIKLTSTAVEQPHAGNTFSGPRGRPVINESKRLDVSAIETGNLLLLSKTNPVPSVKINLFATTDHAASKDSLKTTRIVPNPRFAALLLDTERRLRGLADT